MREQESDAQSLDGDSPSSLGPLPSGRHTYSREQIFHHQRERMIAGITAVVAERGYERTSIGRIAASAHVARRVFYQHFDSKEDCFLAAFDAVVAHLHSLIAEAIATAPGDWPGQMVASIEVSLEFLAANPELANLCLVAAPGVGPVSQQRFSGIAEALAPDVRAGREMNPSARRLPESTEQALIGAIGLRLVRHASLRGPQRLPRLLPELVEFVLTPYLGADEAARIAAEAAAQRVRRAKA